MRSTSLTDYYEPHYAEMRIVIDRLPEIHKAAKLVMSHKDSLYLPAEKATGVPWIFWGVIHFREGSCNPKRQCWNGEFFDRVTKLVPAKRGPWPTWLAAAIALAEHSKWISITKWSEPKMLQCGEKHNGLGGAQRDLDSSYLWAGCHWGRKTGFWIRDHVFDPKAEDPRPGIAPIIKSIVDSGAWTP